MGQHGEEVFSGHKEHRPAKKGRKAEKIKEKVKGKQEGVDPRIKNPKAFAFNSVVRAERKFRRAQDLETKKDRVPLVDRTPVDPPPFVVAIVGPPKVGKSTLFMNIVKNYTRQTLSDIKGPVTIVTGKKRRLTIIECNNDINSMIDVAKVADLALLLVDASFGFEMEVFEFLNICQVHGFPQIMGVLTHLDQFKNKKKLKKTKKTLKHRFWTEVYPGAKLFYLSGYFPMTHTYPKNEVHNLARFISVMKFRPTVWRSEHAYVVADRMEDLTSLEHIRVNPKVDRRISLYGWVHGTFLKQHVSVHIPGLGDFTPDAITALEDPCPLPIKERILRRSLNEREKIMYAPFSGVGGIVYDQDAVYIDLGGSHSHSAAAQFESTERNQDDGGKVSFVGELRELKTTLDEKMESSGLKFFTESEAITGADVESEQIKSESEEEDAENQEETTGMSRNFSRVVSDDGRIRRRVVFDDNNEDDQTSLNNEDEEEDNDDVVESIQKELKYLKSCSKSVNVGNKPKKSKELELNSDSSDEEEEQEEDDDDSEAELKVKEKQKASKNVSSSENHESLSSLVTKLKSKLQPKQSENTEKNKKKEIEEEVEFDEDSDDQDESDSEVNESNLKDKDDLDVESDMEIKDESESDSEVNESNLKDKDDLDVERDVEIKDEDESDIEVKMEEDDDEELDESENSDDEMKADESNSLKNERYSLAEEAFYSRFRNRTMQKMIYDDTDDYMNVSSKAEFDIANCVSMQENHVEKFDEEEMKDFFIGGDYAETAKNILDQDDDDFDDGNSEDDVFGDFEELDDDDDGDTKGKKGKSTEPESEEVSQKNREDLKKKLKEKFDMEYDGGGDEKSFLKDWKAQVEEQTKKNRTFFDDVDDPNLLRDLQGLAPGTYVRVEISRIPCEFISNFDPQRCCPLVVGSLDAPNQETLAVVQARVKKHRWHPKILKTRDPVIMSIGWRRFQTIALYSVQDHNMRNRLIKYTPDHLHCVANFYGPMTPQGTGILGIAPAGFDGFRITLTGTILDMDKGTELVKKLKLVGTPSKIFKKSAFIEGMFSSQLEVAKFVGAKIKTVSGIRGVIKKELRTPLGGFRATFEDKIVLSDIVFCRTWAKVDVPSFYLNLSTHITAQPRLMKTVGQLKREQQIQIEPNPDHLYTPIERQAKHFRPLKIPKSLQGKLPYKDKPKVLAKLNEPKRIAVIKDPHERQMTKFLSTLKTRMGEKDNKEKAEKAKKAAEREKMLKKVEERQNHRQKELRKKVFRTLGLMNKGADNPGGGGKGRRPPKHKRK